MWLVFCKPPSMGMSQNLYIPSIFFVVCVLTWPRIQGSKKIVQKPYIVCTGGSIAWPPTPNQCHQVSYPQKNWVPFNDPPVETIWKKKQIKKKSKHLFPKLPKNHSFFLLPFYLGNPGMFILWKKFLRSDIPRLKKKQPRNFIQVVLREFFFALVSSVYFSSELLS